jgi:hypothetical protein
MILIQPQETQEENYPSQGHVWLLLDIKKTISSPGDILYAQLFPGHINCQSLTLVSLKRPATPIINLDIAILEQTIQTPNRKTRNTRISKEGILFLSEGYPHHKSHRIG